MKKKTSKKNCIDTECMKNISTQLSKIIIHPFGNNFTGSEKMNTLFSFFLHDAPNIESVHSRKIGREKHEALFDNMISGRHFQYGHFCSFNAVIKEEMEKGHIYGDSICLRCKRYVCKRKKPQKNTPNETDLECFLRHIRNAIAHGRVYCLHMGNRINIMFEDYNKTGKMSARIICIKADLEHWKEVLSRPANYA